MTVRKEVVCTVSVSLDCNLFAKSRGCEAIFMRVGEVEMIQF